MAKSDHEQQETERLVARISTITGRELPEWFHILESGPKFLNANEQVDWLVNEHLLTHGYARALIHEYEHYRHNRMGLILDTSSTNTGVNAMIERSLATLQEKPDEHAVSVLVYIAGESVANRTLLDVVEALGQILGAFDLDRVDSSGPLLGSLAYWFRMRRRDFKEATASDLGKELGAEVKRALQLRAVDAEQAKVDDAKAAAATKLIASVEAHDAAVIQVGALLLVKANGVLHVRDLSPREINFLRQHPHSFTDPATVLARLETSITDPLVRSQDRELAKGYHEHDDQ
ncbi:DUF4287 domain-containing protein [Nonomuraea sp. NPDC049158]|uniref:DUF4287 domain-containing protein n=1 Tax=Nonomuraea sp. NPDC049158 TaxID=3155649 RepID=UPI0033C29A15